MCCATARDDLYLEAIVQAMAWTGYLARPHLKQKKYTSWPVSTSWPPFLLKITISRTVKKIQKDEFQIPLFLLLLAQATEGH